MRGISGRVSDVLDFLRLGGRGVKERGERIELRIKAN